MVMYKGTIKSNPYVFFFLGGGGGGGGGVTKDALKLLKKDSKYIYNVTKDTNVTNISNSHKYLHIHQRILKTKVIFHKNVKQDSHF